MEKAPGVSDGTVALACAAVVALFVAGASLSRATRRRRLRRLHDGDPRALQIALLEDDLSGGLTGGSVVLLVVTYLSLRLLVDVAGWERRVLDAIHRNGLTGPLIVGTVGAALGLVVLAVARARRLRARIEALRER